jgi:hypothetical protein
MSEERYNGWTNYATWRVHLEMFDQPCGFLPERFTPQDCKEYCEGYLDGLTDTIAPHSGYDLLIGWAVAFCDDVNWQEIADSLTCDELVF